MQLDDNTLKGQFGEAYVAARLSSDCIVRLTTSLDVGVDLYCETIRENKAFLHFWCQVKTGKKDGRGRFKYDIANDSARYSFERKHLEYWEKQPVPVFAALVPTSWPPDPYPDVYIIDITTQRLRIETAAL
jgi:hypothetical protein